jgi:hypothetical protein
MQAHYGIYPCKHCILMVEMRRDDRREQDRHRMRLKGTKAVDQLHGAAQGDVVSGLGGDDLITGDGGGDRLIGGAGDDTLYGGRESLWPAPASRGTTRSRAAPARTP